MTITACGPICDVGGEYILLDLMQAFSVVGIKATLHCCEHHKEVLTAATAADSWKALPEGPLRRAFEKAEETERAAT